MANHFDNIPPQFRTAYLKNRQRILASQDLCGICGAPVDKTIPYPDALSATVDHIIPIAKGGHPSDMANLQLAHRYCNRQKSDKFLDIKVKFAIAETEISNYDLPLHLDWANIGG